MAHSTRGQLGMVRTWRYFLGAILILAITSSAADPATTTTTSSSTSTTASTTGTNTAFPSVATDFPTLAGTSLPIPTLVVPDTSEAPFMKKSNLPEGTVFIAVGAILGILGAAVLLWRGLVAWSLQRSVQQAGISSRSRYAPDTKSTGTYRPSNAGFSSNYDSHEMSVEMLAGQNTAYTGATLSPVGGGEPKVGKRRGGDRDRDRERDRTPTTSSLFFSPTAGATSSQGTTPAMQSSTYLPAGYYAPGQSAVNSGAPVVHIGGPQSVAGYNRPDSDNYSSPPLTPNKVRSARGARESNTGSLSLGVPPRDRTPSTYLEDMFSNHGYGPRERFHE